MDVKLAARFSSVYEHSITGYSFSQRMKISFNDISQHYERGSCVSLQILITR